MNWPIITLRFVHIVFGALWVGMMLANFFFFMPALREAGPATAGSLRALQRRGFMVVMPVLALGNVISGMVLMMRLSGGSHDFIMHTRMGLAFGLGGMAAVIALVLGLLWLRPAAKRAMALLESLTSPESMGHEENREREAQLRRLQRRSLVAGRAITLLLLFSLTAMSVARYV